ncbi:glutamic acid-rich protein-like [Anneissia japonica]|uniref:glutamic acid-rich protein-like n=1 Tax=Anneissia japonica TaxID=1529436 RepID=UPI001425B445|nr:glutamic acid-rich protein-like [Anneissia japonica]XP_033117196.1 glutamic acid-rich protein-like [Anneissia japonica]
MMGESHNTVNGITMLGAGPSTPVIFERPKSGRRSTTPKLLQRSGSTLEMLTESTGSKINEHQLGKLETTKDRVNSSCSRSSRKCVDTVSANWNTGDDTTLCSGAHKKVVLPSVKRNFEKQGMPNNEVIESFIRSTTPTLNESCVHNTTPTLNESRAKHEPKPNSSIGISSLETGVCGIQLQPKESAAKDNVSEQVKSLSDDYYVSHGYRESSCDDLHSVNPKHGRECKKNVNKPSETQKPSKEDKDDSSEESEDGEEDERKAPIELLGEFLEAVMDEDFQNAQKLCQMILIYEPDNKEANEFKPLIDEELRKERERQLWGSSSEDESSDEDEESDEETDTSGNDDDEETDDESDEDSN